MNYSCYPQFLQIIYIYIYIFRYIIYLGEQSGNVISNLHGTFLHIFMHQYEHNLKIYILNLFFLVNVAVLFANLSSFLPTLLLKIFHYLQVGLFLHVISLKFLSFILPQANILQHFIRFSISKNNCRNQKLSLI